ncbi:MAG: phage transcriptional regulator, AlpA [Polaromonas sp.]|nr:phage transcriptional regulator, AlpA [Polaromonas sp.]
MVEPFGNGSVRETYDAFMTVTRSVHVESKKSTLSITNDLPECGGGESSAGVTDGPEVGASDDDDGGDSDGKPARRPRKESKNRTLKAGAYSRKPPYSLTSDDAGNKMTNSNSGNHRTVTATAGALLILPQNPDIALWRLPTVLAHIPVSRSGWWQGVKTGRYPAPVKLSTRCVAWRSSNIRALIASF